MIRSFSSREKISYARSPRGVCSTTIGISATAPPTPARPAAGGLSRISAPPVARGSWLARGGRLDLRVLDEQRQGLRLAERQAKPVQLVPALQQAPDGLGGAPRVVGETRHLRIHVRLGGGDLL